MKTPTEQPEIGTKLADGNKTPDTPIECIRDERRRGELFAIDLFGEKRVKTILPFGGRMAINAPNEYVEEIKRLFNELEKCAGEAEDVWNKQHGFFLEDLELAEKNEAYARRDENHVRAEELKKRINEIKDRPKEYGGDMDRCYKQLKLSARAYQNHIYGFSKEAIRLTIVQKRRDQYLELIGVIADLLAIEDLQHFHRFEGIENIATGMTRLIGKFEREVVGKIRNPEELEAIQSTLKKIHERVKHTLTK